MKTRTENGTEYYQPETPDERAALAFIASNIPIFHGCQSYGLAAFEAGIKWGRENPAGD